MRVFCALAGLIALAQTLCVHAAATPAKRATVCNGHAELCDRSYGNITFIGAHDSYATSSDPLALARDQEVSISSQLGLGVRMLQAQSHMENGVLHFCHTSCALFDGGTVASYLATVASFLSANPTEVLTLLLTNPESVSLTDVWAPLFEAAGLSSQAYVPSTTPLAQADWPTLGELIDAGTRLVVFMDYGAETGGVDYILPEFEMIWEPPYDSTDNTFPCSVDRTEGPLATTDHMYLLNHFLDINVLGTGILISDPEAAGTTNGVNSIIANANGCSSLGGGRWPSFVLLDFVNLGDAFSAADVMNGIA
ncbi:PLC-like phosphodiesterase [Stereum hirsutum FP-91666 SS1]|uniref:PLC-like phosphodiesterase n=1 Tax=Stereum hirsutum (strain FP-91666) TaxID=721885 RepID=UPI00044106D5|nr:PLC-like phosphodiesterase [Stereum hirsutum FP-91666 SS1]EIM90666.1 PLC-like phosphodiesterase [Stereum hirsutum FP-91666 SS1]